jgi:hypothetical protein
MKKKTPMPKPPPKEGEIWIRRSDRVVVMVDLVGRTCVQFTVRWSLAMFSVTRDAFTRICRRPKYPLDPAEFFEPRP